MTFLPLPPKLIQKKDKNISIEIPYHSICVAQYKKCYSNWQQ